MRHLQALAGSQRTDTIPLPQFVPFRDYMDRTGNHVLSMARLAKDVLAEIPDQFISYMKSRGIKPNPAPPPYTPPGHTHHHTQIWTLVLSAFSARATTQESRGNFPPAGFCGVRRIRQTKEWVLDVFTFVFLV